MGWPAEEPILAHLGTPQSSGQQANFYLLAVGPGGMRQDAQAALDSGLLVR